MMMKLIGWVVVVVVSASTNGEAGGTNQMEYLRFRFFYSAGRTGEMSGLLENEMLRW